MLPDICVWSLQLTKDDLPVIIPSFSSFVVLSANELIILTNQKATAKHTSDIITALLCGKLFKIIICPSPLNGKNSGWLKVVSRIKSTV